MSFVTPDSDPGSSLFRVSRDCLSLNDGQDARPTEEGIAPGERPRSDGFELASCRRNRILSLKILRGYAACWLSVRSNAAEFGSIEVSLPIATGLHHGWHAGI